MGYQRTDNRYRDDRWRGRDDRYFTRGESGRYNYDRDYGRRYDGDDDRGFFDRAGDEVRSWFGDEEAERRREADQRAWERERQMRDRDDYGYERNRGSNYGSAGGGWGNQAGFREERYGAGDMECYVTSYGGSRAASTWGGSGFGGSDDGRRFDRADAGSTGTHGAHPMSAPVGGSAYGAGYGVSAGGFRSSAREGSMMRGSRRDRGDHDPHYSEWRNRQIESLDRDYDEYRRENQSKFESEFGGWRERRQGQRQSLNKVAEHMEVVGSDGEHIGTVDKVRGDRIILTKSDSNAEGKHHSIPCAWIESVDDKVAVSKTAEQAMTEWKNEERNRALFEREDSGSDGPHVLNRSFSGTY